MKTARGPYQNIKCCVACNYKFEDDGERVYRMGVCPNCGHRGPCAGTIADTYDRQRQPVYSGPWWWRTRTWVYKRTQETDRKAAGIDRPKDNGS
jgi:hypothetical protein